MSTPAERLAAIASFGPAIQPGGPWAGRWQLCVRFAGEAETAMMVTADALAADLAALAGRDRFHSIVFAGRDVLGAAPFVVATSEAMRTGLPLHLDTDGQRPAAVAAVAARVALVQVTVPATEPEPMLERAVQTLAAAAAAGTAHALVIPMSGGTSDAQLLRLIERAAAASAGTMLVVELEAPPAAGDPRWRSVLAKAGRLHGDVRLALPLHGARRPAEERRTTDDA